MKVSVIVPVYNVQEYLPKCLDSLLKQNFGDYEIIVVNDGSTDDSMKICQSYAEVNEKIKLFSKCNGGLSSARNFGISKSLGEYIAFVDSDDYVAPNFLSSMYNIAQSCSADLVCCNYYLTEDGKPSRPIGKNTTSLLELDKTTFLQTVFTLSAARLLGIRTQGFVWNKLIKREVIGNKLFKTTPGAEDEIFLADLYPDIKKIFYCGHPLYFYRKRNGSLSKRIGFMFSQLQSRYEIFQNSRIQEKEVLYAACYQYLLIIALKLFVSKNLTVKNIRRLKKWRENFYLPVNQDLLFFKGINLTILRIILFFLQNVPVR